MKCVKCGNAANVRTPLGPLCLVCFDKTINERAGKATKP